MNFRIGLCLLAALFPVIGTLELGAGERRVLLRPVFDPTAEVREVFAAIEAGEIDVEMRPRDETGGALFVENLTDRPLTVQLPEAIVGVQVLPQLFPGSASRGAIGSSTQGQGPGPSQSVGGSANGQGPGSSGLSNFTVNVNGPGNGLFSIPPERVARIEYHSVCLEQGRRTPSRGQIYRLVRIEDFSDDPRLATLLKHVGRDELDPQAVQAAAWHIANGLSWEELAMQEVKHLNAPSTRHFSDNELQRAREIVDVIETAQDEAPKPGDRNSGPGTERKAERLPVDASAE